jgi:hypothetical protein
MAISAEERALRQNAVNFNRSNFRLEGIEPPPEALAIEERYIAGDLDEEGFRAACLAAAKVLAKNPNWNHGK